MLHIMYGLMKFQITLCTEWHFTLLGYDHFPLCLRWCLFILLLLMNALLHTSQEYRRSPLCIR
jgi:hypothetical protein